MYEKEPKQSMDFFLVDILQANIFLFILNENTGGPE